MKSSQLSIFVALVVSASSLVQFDALAYETKVYKWKDADGVWHYDAKPPKDNKAQTVSVKDATASQKSVANQAADANAKEMKANASNSNCDRAREAVRIYENNSKVSLDRDGDGKPEELDESQQIAELERARKLADAYCQ